VIWISKVKEKGEEIEEWKGEMRDEMEGDEKTEGV
jgi:hypothetical protein